VHGSAVQHGLLRAGAVRHLELKAGLSDRDD
jgi:hypothetical protein